MSGADGAIGARCLGNLEIATLRGRPDDDCVAVVAGSLGERGATYDH